VPDANISPQGRGTSSMNKINSLIARFDKIKTKYPEVLILIKDEDYYSFRDDAVRVSRIAGTSLYQTNYNGTEIQYTSFDFHFIDAFLPALVKAGSRVGICEIK
jgi:DNA mismatch repair protein MutS